MRTALVQCAAAAPAARVVGILDSEVVKDDVCAGPGDEDNAVTGPGTAARGLAAVPVEDWPRDARARLQRKGQGSRGASSLDQPVADIMLGSARSGQHHDRAWGCLGKRLAKRTALRGGVLGRAATHVGGA